MTGPKHLWSGDWEEESAARAGGTARRDTAADPTPGPDGGSSDPGSGPPPHRRTGLIAGAVTVAVLAIVAIVIASSGGSDPQAPTTHASASVPTTQSNPQTAPSNPTPSTPTNPTQSTPTNPGTGTSPSPTTSTTSSTTTTPTVAPQPVSWLGMEVITVPNGTAVVDTVTPGGAGDLAGLNPADTITAINGRAITGSASIAKTVRGLRKGAVITLTIDRGGTTLNPQATFTGPPTAYP